MADQDQPDDLLTEAPAYPDFVVGPASRERWDEVMKIVQAIDPNGSSEDHWYLGRNLFWSDIPTK